MAEKIKTLRSTSHAVLPVDSQPRSVSDSTMVDEGRGRSLDAAPQYKPHNFHPSPRRELCPATFNPLRAPSTVIARPAQLDLGLGAPAASYISVLGSDRLRPLTPIHTKSNSGGGAMFTTSPASSDFGSPHLPHIKSSLSNTSLNNHHLPNRGPQPPTPTAKGGRAVRPSSLPRRSHHSCKSSQSGYGTPHPHGKPSVKHLTCFWWKEKGDCRFKEEDCLYAHRDTGLYADPPRQVIPGGEIQVVQRPSTPCCNLLTNHDHLEPAMAGKSLDRALKKLHSDFNKSPGSLKSMSPEIIHADMASRSGTLGTEPPTSPTVFEQLKGIENAYAAVKSDNVFLRSLVEQNTKEKSILITTVDNLQLESKGRFLQILSSISRHWKVPCLLSSGV